MIVYSMDGCSQCVQAINMIKQRGIDYSVKKVGVDITRDELVALLPAGERRMPQIEVEGSIIGSVPELTTYLRSV